MTLEEIEELCEETGFNHKVSRTVTISDGGLLFVVNVDEKNYELYPVRADKAEGQNYQSFISLFERLGYQPLAPHI